MATEHIHRKYEGKDDDDLLQRADARLEPYCKSLSLKKEVEPQSRNIKISRTGLKGNLDIKDSTIDIQLDYSMLIPGPIRRIVREKIEAAMDELYPE